MRRIAFIFALLCGVASAQLTYGPAANSTVTFTVSVSGAGSGSVADGTGQITGCTSGGGSCSATYNTGASVTLTATPTGGANTTMSGGTDGASVCSGSTTLCSFTITANATLSVVFSSSGGGAIPASPMFSIDINSSSQFAVGGNCSGTYLNCIALGQIRLWDTPFMQVPFLLNCTNGTNICAANAITYNFSTFDTVLATYNTNAVRTAQMDMARTPVFATSGLGTGANCNYFQAGSTQQYQQAGQCYPPTDLNNDGTGTNQYLRNIWAKIMAHAVGKDGNAGYLNTHAHILYWEVWNEPSFIKFWRGTFAQLIRLEEDSYALVKGYSTLGLTFTSVNGAGVYVMTSNPLGIGNNLAGAHYNIGGFTNGTNNKTNFVVSASTTTSITLCNPTPSTCSGIVTTPETHAATGTYVNQFTGETDATIQASVTSGSFSYPLDTTAFIVMPPYFGEGAGLTGLPQFLYCTSQLSNCGPASEPASIAMGGHLLTDAINFHGKAGNDDPTLPEAAVGIWVSNIQGDLQPADLLKPLENTEGGYAGCGWAPTTNCQPNNSVNYTIPNNQGSYYARMILWHRFQGVTNHVWYNWNPNQSGIGGSVVNFSTNSIFNWLVGTTGFTCSSVSSVSTCTFTKPDGVAAQIMWDTNNPCTATACATTNRSVPSPMLHYISLVDTTQTLNNVVSHQVPVGFVPVYIEAE